MTFFYFRRPNPSCIKYKKLLTQFPPKKKNAGCGIAPLAHNLPNCRTVGNAIEPQWPIAVNIIFLEVFVCDSQPEFVVVFTWLPHVTDAGQSATSLLLDDSGRQSESHALYYAAFTTDGGPRPPEIMSKHQNIVSSGPVDHQNI